MNQVESTQRRAEIAHAVARCNLSATQAAQRFGVSIATVRLACKIHNVQLKIVKYRPYPRNRR